MELHRPSQHTLCSRSLRPLLDALVELTRDADLDDAEVSLRLDQYAECALGTLSAELAFDPTAMELTALASTVEVEVFPRWSRRVNALYLAHQLGRAHELRATEAFVLETLRHERYLDGTRYYPSPDTFLHFLGRLVCDFPRAYGALRPALARAILRRRGVTTHPIDVAQRVLLARRLGFVNPIDESRLHALRKRDGAWPADCLFRYGRSGVLFGSESLSTAFARRALDAVNAADARHAVTRRDEGVRHAS